MKNQNDSTKHKQISLQPIDDRPPQRKIPNYIDMVEYPHEGTCQQLAFMLIRPPRFIYNPQLLKPSFRNNQRFTMETIDIGFDLTIYKQKFVKYIVLYLHGNGSSRFEGSLFLHSMPQDVGLACFDFAACGNRYDSQFITLGQEESKDVDRAAKYLKSQGYRVVGWGRSMGGVSLLKSKELDIMVSDSAYSNLHNLCTQSSAKSVPSACCCFFHILFPCVFSCLKCKVHSKSGLDIDEMNIAQHLKIISKSQNNKQICFLHGQEDSLIPVHHAHKLYQSFNGRKLIIVFQGTHNSARDDEVIQRCFQFIEQGLKNTILTKTVQNPKLIKMTELQQLNKQFDVDQKTIPVSSSTIKISLSPKNSQFLERNATHTHLHSEYCNGVTSHQLPTSMKDENYNQAGQEAKIQITLREQSKKDKKEQKQQNGQTTFSSVLKDPFKSQRKGMSLSTKQQSTLKKIFKQ